MTMQSSSYPSAPTHSTPSYPPPPATGIPVSSTNQFSSDKPAPTHFQSHPPPPFQISQTNQEVLVPWSTGLCDCFDDCGNCCLTYWCPCVTFGHTSEIVDRGTSSCGSNGALYVLVGMFTGCPCIYSCFYRTKLRKLYKIEGDGCCDCLTHTFCGVCALTQEYRELEKKGFDMSLGWHDNMERQNKVVTPPMVQGGMQR